MKETMLSVLLVLALVLSLVLVLAPNALAADTIELLYDDRKDLSELIGVEAVSVEITDQTVRSCQVGTTTADTAVLTYDAQSDTLYAVGTGTATVVADGVSYKVTVSAAPLSMFLITGHSVGYGQYGDGAQSVAIEAGQAYSSWWRDSLTSAEGGLGYGSATRAGGTGEGSIDAFAEGQSGTRGVGSALAYRWNQLTGEKVWVMNLAVPGSCINEWQPGVTGWHYDKNGTTKYMYKYESVLEHFGYAQQIMKNEIAAGHYTLRHMSMLYFSGANFSNAAYTDWTYESLKSDYETLWNGLKKDLAMDMDGDGVDETLETLGFVPFWTPTNIDYKQDKAVNYIMAASSDYSDVMIASDVYRDWMTEAGLSGFPAISYTTQGTAVAMPESVKHSNQGGSSENSIFCSSDTSHLSQVAYNAVGLDMADSLYAWYTGNNAVNTVSLQYVDGSDVPETIQVNHNMTSSVLVPVLDPAYSGNVTYSVSDNLELKWPLAVKGLETGVGTLTVYADGVAVNTLTVEVLDQHVHCVCGGHTEGVGNHSCTDVEWIAWGTTDTEKTTLPTTAGNYYLVSNVTISAAQNMPAGAEINLCLNGYSVTAATRLFNVKGTTGLTDCGAEADWGTASSTSKANYGAVFYVYENATMNLYAGNLDASGSQMLQGGVAVIGNSAAATMNMYGGNVTGGTLVTKTSSSDTRGGAFYLIAGSTFNMYGGTVSGGSSVANGGNFYIIGSSTLNVTGGTISGGSAAKGGNIYNAGTVNISGGTVTGGVSSGNGGNIAAASGKITVSGGTVTAGSATNGHGGNIDLDASTLTVSGGTVSAGMAAVSGKQGGNINLNSGSTCTLTGGTVSGGIAGTYGGNICGTPGAKINISGSALVTGGATGTTGAGTSGNGGNIYAGANDSGSLCTVTISGGTVTGGKALKGGNLYVDGSCTVSGGTVSGGVVPATNANALGGNFFVSSRATGGILKITGGTISGGSGYNGGSIGSNGNTTISGGTISGGRAYYCGGNIYQVNDADRTLTISGGTVKGGYAKLKDTGNNNTDYPATCLGGNIYIHGVNDSEVGHMVLSGGTVSGGIANCGGNIYCNGTMVINGGTVTGGTVYGSNSCGGNLYLGMIRNSSTGEIYCTVNMFDGLITNGYATSTGGNAQIHGNFYMYGGTFSGGSAVSGGNIRLFRPANFVLDGGTVTGGTARNIATSNGGNVFQIAGYTSTAQKYSLYATLTFKSGLIEGGTHNVTVNGGAIQVYNYGVFNMEGGTLIGGVANYRVWDGAEYLGRGGAIGVRSNTAGYPAIVNISGGEIIGGTSGNYGGIIAAADCAGDLQINISGGTFTGGTAQYGGILSTEGYCTVNITGGTFTGGTATDGGLFWLSGGADVSISGGTFSGGTASGVGDGICVADAILTVQDGAQFNGTGTNLYVDNTVDSVSVTLKNLTDRLIVVDAADKTAAFASSEEDISAALPCADEGYVTVWSEGSLSMTENAADAVAAVCEGSDVIARYATFEAAAKAAVNTNSYVKLLTDVETGFTLTGALWLDMNGYDLTGLTVSGTLYGMDSATNGYTDSNVGVLTATVSGTGTVVTNCKTSTALYGSVMRYLAIPGEGTYTFHRFYVGITKISIKPSTVGVGYKAVFAGSDTVKAYLDQSQAFGYNIWVNSDNVVTRTFDAQRLTSLDEVTLRVDNFLNPDNDTEVNRQRAQLPVNATVFVKLSTGEIIETSAVDYSFRDMMELADANYETYSAAQQTALTSLSPIYTETVFDWAIPNTHHAEGGMWTAWTSATSLPTSGTVYLDTDVTISTVVRIPADSHLMLCLNGHTINGTSRIFYVSGELSICDCCHAKAEEEQGYMIGNGSTLAPVLYTYYGSTVNLYNGNLTASKQVAQGGILALGNDKVAEATGEGDTVFNMYGGKIYGGNVTGNGGNIVTWHGGVLNMYGGEISGGTAGGNGGNICYASATTDSANLVINLYGGLITGGVAGNCGGNLQGNAQTELHIYGGEISGGYATSYGGNIYTAASVATMDGGLIRNGKAQEGGNIYIVGNASTQIVLENGTVTGGQATVDGGNLHITNKGTYTLNNMTISDGVAGSDGANIYLFRDMNEANTSLIFPTMTVTGGNITGGEAGDKGSGIYVQEGILTLSGNVNITGNAGSNLYLDAGQTVTLQDLTADAKIGLSMNIAGSIAENTAYAANLIPDDDTLSVQNVNGMLKLTGGLSANVPELTGYSVGWYRGDITPTEPMPLDGMGNNVGRMDKWEIKTNLEAGFTVIADETGIENAIILVSVDTLFIQKELSGNLCAAISDATGIPANRIFLSASHTHCGVDHDAIYEPTREYLENFYNVMTQYAVLAVEDLSPATIETGSINVVSEEGNSLNLSRRYIGDDGNAYSSVDSASYPPPSGALRESDYDSEMQLIRFVREDGTDVVLTNWQAHPSGYASSTYGYVSAENWKNFRESVESQMEDTVCTFFLGAAGNLSYNTTANLKSFTAPDGVTYDATSMAGKGNAMAAFAVAALNEGMTQVEAGTLKVVNFTFETEDLYKSNMQSYKNIDLDLNAICIGGDIAFITSPYEMFHENGSQIKAFAESVGFETCFVLTNSMGENKYIGANNSFENDNTDGTLTSFGVRTCRYVQGTAEKLIDQLADMLSELQGTEIPDTIFATYTVYVVDTEGNPVQNVMVQLVGGNNARNCSNADGTIVYYVYEGIDYSIEVCKLPDGYSISGDATVFTFNEEGELTVTVEKS